MKFKIITDIVREVNKKKEEGFLVNSRSVLIDMIKGIGILLIVIGHNTISETDIVKETLFSFHVPLFFIVSGYLFHFEKYSEIPLVFLKKKAKRLLVPYFLFSFLLTFNLWRGHLGDHTIISHIQDVLLGQAGWKVWSGYISPLWFLIALFSTECVFFILRKALCKSNALIEVAVHVFLCLAGFYMGKHKIFLPWEIDIAFVAQMFMFIGYKFRSFNIGIDRLNSKLGFIVLLLIQILVIRLNGRVDMNGRYYNDLFVYLVGGISGTLIVMWLSNLLVKVELIKKVFTFLGKASLIVLSLHIFYIGIYYNHIYPLLFHSIKSNIIIANGFSIICSTTLSLITAFIFSKIRVTRNLFFG